MEIITVIAVLCAFVVKGMCGFANTLVFGTIMSFSADNVSISPLEVIVGYPSNIVMAWNERKSISVGTCIRLSAFVILGSIPGAVFLKNGNTECIKILFGLTVVLVGVEAFFREYQKKKSKTSPAVLAIIGVVSGLLCGLFGIGALLAAYVSRTTENSSQFKGTICVVFLVENTFRILLYTITGIITFEIFKNAVILLPVMLIGLVSGIILAKIVDEKIVRKAVIVLLILSGISLIINNLRL